MVTCLHMVIYPEICLKTVVFPGVRKKFTKKMALKYLSISSLKTESCSENGLLRYEEMLVNSLESPTIRGFAQDTSNRVPYLTSLAGRKKNLKPTAVPSIFFWKQEEGPEEKKSC